MAQGSGDQIPISSLQSQVEVGLGDSESTLERHRQSLRDTQEETQRLGRATEQMAQSQQTSAASVRRVTTELRQQEEIIAELERLKQSAGGAGAAASIETALQDARAKVEAYRQQLGQTAEATTQVAQVTQQAGTRMRTSFIETTSSVDELRAHLANLQELQSRGIAQGVRTPGLQEEIERTGRALREVGVEVDTHVQRVGRMSASHIAARQSLQGLSSGITQLAGSAVPGLTQLDSVSGALGQQFIGMQGAAGAAALGVTAVAAAAIAAGAVLTTLGAQQQESVARLAATANISIETAREQERAFQAIDSGGKATAEAYANIAGQLTVYNGQALTTAQATDLMAVSQEAATASGQALDAVTKGLAATLIATHTPLSDSRELMNILYITSLNTGIGMDQLGAAAGRIIERTGTAAPSVRDLGIALTIAAQAGASGTAGLSSMDKLIQSLGNSSPAATKNLEGLGIAVVKNAQGGLDLAQTLLNLKGGYDGLANDAQKYALAQSLVGENAGTLQAMLGLTDEQIQRIIKSYEDNNRVSQDAELRSNTLGQMMGRLAQQAKDAAANIGEGLAGALVSGGQQMDLLGSSIEVTNRQLQAFLRNLNLAAGIGKSSYEQEGFRHIAADYAEELKSMAKAGDDWAKSQAEQLDQRRSSFQAYTQAELDGIRDLIIAHRQQQQAAASAGDDTTVGVPQPDRAGLDVSTMRQQQELLSSMTSEAWRLHEAMLAVADPKNLPGGDEQQKALNAYLGLISQEEAAIRRAYDPANPQQMVARLGELQSLTKGYEAAVADLSRTNSDADRDRVVAIQYQIDALNQRIQRETTAHDISQKNAAFEKQQAAEVQRRAREAREADPLLGISQSLARDRDQLMGTAGQVMGDLNKAIELKGQQGARAAGEAFGNEARKWGEELEKAGVENWQASFDRLIELGRVAITSGSPEVVGAVRELLVQAEQEVREANIGKAMEQAMAKANAQMLDATSKNNDQLLRAQVTGADARNAALQQEVDREYDVWAGRQIERLETTDRNNRELLRINEQWGREDLDRAEQQARARSDRDEQSNRDARNRAQDQARAMVDLSEQQARAQGDVSRGRAREDADAQYEHQKRIREIQRRGGDPTEIAKALAQENESFTSGIQDRTRKRAQDDAEAAIKRAQQVSDAQKRQAETVADANRRAAEQASDLQKRQGEQESDLAKTRSRQLAARTVQQGDAEWLKNQRIAHEEQFHVSAEEKAAHRFQNELARIDARYQHEEARAAAAAEQIRLKNEHELEIAAIRAQEKFGAITPAESTRLQGESELTFTQQSASIQENLRQREAAIDQAYRQQVAGRQQYARGFSPQNIPFEMTPGYRPPTPSFGRADFAGGAESLFSGLAGQTKLWQMQFMGQQAPSGPVPVVLPDEQIQEIIDGVGNLPPMELDGEVVESSTSRIRKNRNLSRTVG